MFSHETKVRVRYGETDQMGYAYYGVYASYYEVGRVETLRQLGLSYKEMEERGIMLPVHTFNIIYHKPALYDDELTIKTTIPGMPGVRIKFNYQCFNAEKELLNEGEIVLVFVNKETKKPCQPPSDFLDSIEKYFRK